MVDLAGKALNTCPANSPPTDSKHIVALS